MGMPPRGRSGDRRGDVISPVRQKVLQVGGKCARDESQDEYPGGSPPATEGPSPSQGGSALLKYKIGEGPPGSYKSADPEGSSLRCVAARVKARLATIHPNPGPVVTRRGRSGRAEENRRSRRERRYERRRVRRRERRVRERVRRAGGEREIVTWNVQKMSMREANRAKLRRVCERVIKEGWEIVCLTELTAEMEGVVWIGEEEERIAIVHSMKCGVLLTGGALEKWVSEGSKRWFSERVTTVVFGGLRVVSAYQPVWRTNEDSMSMYRRELERQVASGGNERLVIGGDFNSNVGRMNEREGVCGKFGVGRMNEAGRDLIDWCEENGLVHVNSYMKHARRGTWFNLRYGRWYELDGFLVRKNERHRMIERMRTLSEWGLSDHRAKVMRIRPEMKKWRTSGEDGKRVPRIRWEVLKDEEKREAYKEKTSELLNARDQEEENVGEWERMSKVMLKAAEEVCGKVKGKVKNPWVVGHEEELDEMNARINEAVNGRNECERLMEARRRLRGRAHDENMREIEIRMENARERVKETRKELKRFMKSIEREWWSERITECKEACERGRIGDMYKILREVGAKDAKAAQSVNIGLNDFKEHFERVSRERYEVEPRVIQEVIENARDLREDDRANEANDLLNEMPEREEIEKAMEEMKDSAPGEDGVRLRYIKEACEEVKEKVIETVQMMFERNANEWEKCVKVGIMVPLFKKGSTADVNNYRGVCLLSMCSRVLARVIAKRSVLVG